MGADPFITYARGDSAREAFNTAVEDARYESGNGGYTGSIAEKERFIEIKLPEEADPVTEANMLIEEDDERICDKWGPAGFFSLGNSRYLFFGWASS